jgi:hypothetical protein
MSFAKSFGIVHICCPCGFMFLCPLQVSAGRPIPVLPQHTFPGNVVLSSRAISGLSPPVLPDAELEKLCLGHLAAAAKDALNALAEVPSSASADEQRPIPADTSDESASDHMSGMKKQDNVYSTCLRTHRILQQDFPAWFPELTSLLAVLSAVMDENLVGRSVTGSRTGTCSDSRISSGGQAAARCPSGHDGILQRQGKGSRCRAAGCLARLAQQCLLSRAVSLTCSLCLSTPHWHYEEQLFLHPSCLG